MADAADRNDADLVIDVRAGNAGSFAYLFDRWFGPVLGAAQDVLGERAEAARVATDTFQSVWLHLDELADPAEFGSWILLTSRTFARRRQAERDPSAVPPSGPLFDNEDELRRAVGKILVRRQVPAVGQSAPAARPSAVSSPAPGAGPSPALPPAIEPVLVVAGPDQALDRQHRYHWASMDTSPGLADRFRSFRPSPGTLVAMAIMLLGSVIWLMSRDGTSQIDGGQPAPGFSPWVPTTIDGAAARSNSGSDVAVGGSGVATSSLPPDPATPATAATAVPDGSRKVKVTAVVPRSAATTPTKRRTTAAAAPKPVAVITTATTAPIVPRSDDQATTTESTASSSSGSSTPSTTRPTATTARGSTTATTGRTTTSAEVTTSRGGPTTTAKAGVTTTTRDSATTTTGRTTTAGGASSTRGSATSRTSTTANVTTTTAGATTPTSAATTRATVSTTTTRPAAAALPAVAGPLVN